MSNATIRELADHLEWALAALANQKFVNELPPCGDAMAMDPKDYGETQRGIQQAIDRIYVEGWAMLARVRGGDPYDRTKPE